MRYATLGAICAMLVATPSLADESSESGMRAAGYFAMASNGGESCRLRVDRPRLYRRVLQDGMNPDVLATLSGESLSPEAQGTRSYREQYGMWTAVLRSFATYQGGPLKFCQEVYDAFGPSGSVYPGVVAKPVVPYSPDQLQ